MRQNPITFNSYDIVSFVFTIVVTYMYKYSNDISNLLTSIQLSAHNIKHHCRTNAVFVYNSQKNIYHSTAFRLVASYLNSNSLQRHQFCIFRNFVCNCSANGTMNILRYTHTWSDLENDCQWIYFLTMMINSFICLIDRMKLKDLNKCTIHLKERYFLSETKNNQYEQCPIYTVQNMTHL